MTDPSAVEQRLIALFEAHSASIYGYAVRRGAVDAEDVVSETFLVAWRRRDDVPDDALPWLLVVARNVISNITRTHARHPTSPLNDTADRIPATELTEETALERAALLSALNRLADTDREALLLIAWDGLTIAQAALVQDCSVRAFHVRLYRARRRFRAALALDSEQPESSAPERTSAQEATS